MVCEGYALVRFIVRDVRTDNIAKLTPHFFALFPKNPNIFLTSSCTPTCSSVKQRHDVFTSFLAHAVYPTYRFLPITSIKIQLQLLSLKFDYSDFCFSPISPFSRFLHSQKFSSTDSNFTLRFAFRYCFS